jgi:4-oxalocrotonate tautomerase
MPVITAHILEGRTSEQKAALIRALTDAAVRTLHVSEDSVRVILSTMAKDEYGIGGKTASELGR